MTILGLVVVMLFLIPIVAIFLDSELGKALARRLEPQPPPGADAEIDRRLEALEEEMEYVSEAVRSLQARLRQAESEGEA